MYMYVIVYVYIYVKTQERSVAYEFIQVPSQQTISLFLL